MRLPSPVRNPNAYATLGSGSVAAFLIFEFHDRLGVDFNTPEQSMIVALVAALYVLAGKKVHQ